MFATTYGFERVDATSWRGSLITVAKALNRGDRSLAAIALVQARIPPISSRPIQKYDPDAPWIKTEINNTENVVLIPKVIHLLITAEMNTGNNRAVVKA